MPPSTQQIELEARFKDLMSKGVDNASKKTSSSLGGLVKRLGVAAGGFLALRSAVNQAGEMVKLASQAETVSKSFSRLAQMSGQAADVFMGRLREASQGTISDLELMQKANEAAILGGEELIKDLPRLIEIARASAQATGKSFEQLFGDITLGIGRQSKQILDNLGLIIDVDAANKAYAATLKNRTAASLTEAERKQAFMNAVLKQGDELVKNAGSSATTSADSFARLGAAVENLQRALGEKLLPIVTKVAGQLADGVDLLNEMAEGNSETTESLLEIAEANKRLEKAQKELKGIWDEQLETGKDLSGVYEFQAKRVEALQRRVDDLTRSHKKLVSEQERTPGKRKAKEEAPPAFTLDLAAAEQLITQQADIERQGFEERRAMLLEQLLKIEGEDQAAGDRRLEIARKIAALEIEVERQKQEELDRLAQEAEEREAERQQRRVDAALVIAETVGTEVAAIAIEAFTKEQEVAKRAGIAAVNIAKSTAAEVIKIKEAEAISQALGSAPFPANLIPAAIVKAKFAVLKAIVGAAGGAASAAVAGGGQQQQDQPRASGARRLPRGQQRAEDGGVSQELNLSVSVLDPTGVNWDKLVQDNIGPALESAVDRNAVTINVRGG